MRPEFLRAEKPSPRVVKKGGGIWPKQASFQKIHVGSTFCPTSQSSQQSEQPPQILDFIHVFKAFEGRHGRATAPPLTFQFLKPENP